MVDLSFVALVQDFSFPLLFTEMCPLKCPLKQINFEKRLFYGHFSDSVMGSSPIFRRI